MFSDNRGRSVRAKALTKLAVGIADRGWPCPRRLAECIVNADAEAALAEGRRSRTMDDGTVILCGPRADLDTTPGAGDGFGERVRLGRLVDGGWGVAVYDFNGNGPLKPLLS
jgi:hypothetical protein